MNQSMPALVRNETGAQLTPMMSTQALCDIISASCHPGVTTKKMQGCPFGSLTHTRVAKKKSMYTLPFFWTCMIRIWRAQGETGAQCAHCVHPRGGGGSPLFWTPTPLHPTTNCRPEDPGGEGTGRGGGLGGGGLGGGGPWRGNLGEGRGGGVKEGHFGGGWGWGLHAPKATCWFIAGSPHLTLPSLEPLSVHPNPNHHLKSNPPSWFGPNNHVGCAEQDLQNFVPGCLLPHHCSPLWTPTLSLTRTLTEG